MKKRSARILFPLPVLGIGLFCLYGFTTTFEPMDRGVQLTWRVVYASGAVACAVVLALLLTASVRADTRERPVLGSPRRASSE